ncbi:hypothetical protein BZA77DRAFT_388060 [Pyronema omphalodes]|nr:hypothetical protein BZA77DRAFT_388060 [Pyronema omphalodes]
MLSTLARRPLGRIAIARPVYQIIQSRNTNSLPASHTDLGTPKNIKSVAILGGGITGLSAAWYLSRLAPDVPITLYESSNRLGGWLRTKRVKYDGGSVVFETGPRTLRANSVAAMVTLDMIRQLQLEDQLNIVHKEDPSAKNRFIYLNNKLNKVPNSVTGMLFGVLTNPVLKGLVPGVLAEHTREQRPKEAIDESVGSFIARRLNDNVADNLVSSVFHGIYAGDIDKLSARSLLPKQWRLEGKYGSITKGLLKNNKEQPFEDTALRFEMQQVDENAELIKAMQNASVFTFKDGIETLSNALVEDLMRSPMVEIRLNDPVEKLVYNWKDSEYPLAIDNHSYSHVLSTLLGPVTNSMLPKHAQTHELGDVEATNVVVVNLFYKTPNLVPKGFGYLLPKSVPEEANPHRALGVIFDSLAEGESGTKLTVMMGGHWWSHIHPSKYPNDIELTLMARDTLRMHLGIHEIPVASYCAVNKNCIPQYHMGHEYKMATVHKSLKRNFHGRIAVAGPTYAGVGVHDCIRSARATINGWLENNGEFTGLERQMRDDWVDISKFDMTKEENQPTEEEIEWVNEQRNRK